jgi:hypothetical protein
MTSMSIGSTDNGSQADKNAVTPAQSPQDAPDKSMHTDIRGRFNQYTSGFWALALPAIAARYVGRYLLKIAQFDPKVPHEVKPGNRLYAVIVGTGMAGMIGLYSARTWGDMKRVFSETLAYEFDKKPEEIGIHDFMASKNAIVQRTMKNFIKYNSRRTVVASTFFAFLLGKLGGQFKRFQAPEADSVDLGVGATGAYLFSDVLNRKVTFFEAMQNFIDRKINHQESVGEVITDNDLMNLYAVHARENATDHLVAQTMDTIGWRKDQVIFGRMAELMNQTYRNTPTKERADFTVPKLIYLLGEGLITRENIDHSLAYIELANRHGMTAVKQVVREVKEGKSFDEALSSFPISHPKPEAKKQEPAAPAGDTHVARLNELKKKEMIQSDLRYL